MLASAMQYDLAAILDQRRVRVCGLAEIVPQPALATGGPARELVDRLLEAGARDAAAMALVLSEMNHEHQAAGFHLGPLTAVELSVAEPTRRGAPMTLIRGGEERDLAAIVAMGQVRANPYRFRLDRDVDFVQYATRRSDCSQVSAPMARASCSSSLPKKGLPPLPTSSSASSAERGPLRSAATVIPPVRESAPFYRRSSHVNRSSAAQRSAPGFRAALSLRRSRLCPQSPREK